ncbi:MAG: tRNA (N(6)-L-threonylcarbamoyladenosine(37)-C(2))-methylthiotransferase MtaB [Clostridia bacterium]|nr:tRNA (N(6)-L-threonylcarbamoyladenosine(37)-C(2))-methylthiotransferase MtaB [Clostridia bacterium]
MKVAVYTLGCKVNQYESEALTELLEKEGVSVCSSGADACIINTCAVTAESERKARQTVRRAVKENPGAYVLVTGCAVQIDGDRFAGIPGVHYVSGSRRKTELVAHILKLRDEGIMTTGANVCDPALCPYEEMTVSGSGRTRAYMKVEDGCGNRCAYCVIPRARGPVVSRPVDACVGEARRLAEAGYREIVLTGIEIASYGEDLDGVNLCDLVEALEEVKGLERVRLSSVDPSFFRPEICRRLGKCGKLAHHFHLSLQSGCDRTLAAMRRKYSTALAKRNIGALRAVFPDVRFTADVIVGFPGEREEDFEETLAFMDLPGFLHVHVFAYSPRPLTEAAGMPDQVPEETKRTRSARLIARCAENEQKTLSEEVGRTVFVLFENGKAGYQTGHTGNFIEVRVRTKEDLCGRILPVRVTGAQKEWVEGTLLSGEGETGK